MPNFAMFFPKTLDFSALKWPILKFDGRLEIWGYDDLWRQNLEAGLKNKMAAMFRNQID